MLPPCVSLVCHVLHCVSKLGDSMRHELTIGVSGRCLRISSTQSRDAYASMLQKILLQSLPDLLSMQLCWCPIRLTAHRSNESFYYQQLLYSLSTTLLH
jgi:hypothetical protein